MHRELHSSGVAPWGRLRRTLVSACAVWALAGVSPAAGQEPTPSPLSGATMAASDSVQAVAGGVTPGGAFLRAVLLPGWGHASIGSYHRGAFYFVVEGATAWTLLKTRRRYSEAEDRVRFQEALLRSDLEAQGVTDEAEILEALDADPTLEDLRNLQEARRQQREDWTAVGIFLLFLSGADAFVSAHLKDFPVPLELNAQPVGNGRMELSVGFSLPR